MKSSFLVALACVFAVSAAPLLKRQTDAAPAVAAPTAPVSGTHPLADTSLDTGSASDDSVATPAPAHGEPVSESYSGTDPAQLDKFLAGDGKDGDDGLSGLGSTISAVTAKKPGNFDDLSTSDPTSVLSSLGFSPEEVAEAQAQQNQQNQQQSPATGLTWPSNLSSLSGATPADGATADATPADGAADAAAAPVSEGTAVPAQGTTA